MLFYNNATPTGFYVVSSNTFYNNVTPTGFYVPVRSTIISLLGVLCRGSQHLSSIISPLRGSDVLSSNTFYNNATPTGFYVAEVNTGYGFNSTLAFPMEVWVINSTILPPSYLYSLGLSEGIST